MKKYLFFTFIILYLLISIHSQMMQDINNKNLKNINNNSSEGFDNKLIIPSDNGGMFGILEPTDKFTLNVIENEFNIFNGKKTDLLIYETLYKNIKYLNPVIKIKKDSIFKADLSNGLNEETIIHWHGILSDSHNDGIPQQAISTGNNYNYDFKVLNRGGTYWYHPHPHKKTAKQVYMGLAGFLLLKTMKH